MILVMLRILRIPPDQQYTAAIDVVGSRTFWTQALHFLDYKLLLIPLGFILLRVWTCVVNILFTYVGVPLSDLPAWLCNMLIYLSVSKPIVL